MNKSNPVHRRASQGVGAAGGRGWSGLSERSKTAATKRGNETCERQETEVKGRNQGRIKAIKSFRRAKTSTSQAEIKE